MRQRSGFTLVEVMVALAVAALIVMLGHRLLGAAIDGSREIRHARLELDRESNAWRWLRAAFRSLDVEGTEGGFDGRPGRVSFSAWLQHPAGWFQRSRLTLEAGDGSLRAHGIPGGALILADSVSALELDYLLEPGASTRWAGTWVSPVSAPLAVRVRLVRIRTGREVVDTLFFLVGERG